MSNLSVRKSLNYLSLKLLNEISFNEENFTISTMSVYSILNLLLYSSRSQTKSEVFQLFNSSAIPSTFNNEQEIYDSTRKLLNCFPNAARKRIGPNSRKAEEKYNFILNLAFQILFVNKGLLSEEFTNRSAIFDLIVKLIKIGDAIEKQKLIDLINAWTKETTRNRLLNIKFDEKIFRNEPSIMIFATVFQRYFLVDAFSSAKTRPAPFKCSNMKTVVIDTMCQRLLCKYSKSSIGMVGIECVILTCTGDIEMIIITLSKDTTLSSINSIFQTFNLKNYNNLIASTKETKIELFLPMFHVESKIDLVPYLKNLGLKSAFDKNEADFTGLINVYNEINEDISKPNTTANVSPTEETSKTAETNTDAPANETAEANTNTEAKTAANENATEINTTNEQDSSITNKNYISHLYQCNFIEINEEGISTESGKIYSKLETESTVTVKINRPFVFIIRESKRNLILTVGKIEKF